MIGTTLAAEEGMIVTFEMNGRAYETDPETLDVLRSVAPAAAATGDASAVAAVMELGLLTGRIRLTGGAA